jgi:hypothetical protein
MLITNAKIEEGINWHFNINGIVHEYIKLSYLTYLDYKKNPNAYRRNINKSLANMLTMRGNELSKADIASFYTK